MKTGIDKSGVVCAPRRGGASASRGLTLGPPGVAPPRPAAWSGLETLESRVLMSTALLPAMPAPLVPADHPALPAGFDAFTPPTQTVGVITGAPTLAEWTRIAGPDDSILVTGDQLSSFGGADAGKDARFLIYGQTSGSDGALRDGDIQRLDGNVASVTLPSELPAHSMYFVWAENADGVAAPVALNKTDAWWAGPDNAAPGQVVSIYGQNLSHDNGTSQSWVYLQPVAGGAGQWLDVGAVNPYKVDVTLPSGLAAGDYQLWVHNGHGGDYGWSAPVSLTVKAAAKWDGPTVNVKDFGAKGDGTADDTAAIRRAFEAVRATSNATIYFPRGTYIVTESMYLVGTYGTAQRLVGDGSGVTTIRAKSDSQQSSLLNPAGRGVEITGITLDGNNAPNMNRVVYARDARDLHLRDVVINARLDATIDLHMSRGVVIENCTFIGASSFLGNCSQLFIDHCRFYGTNDSNEMLYSWGGSEISITNCVASDLDSSNPNSGDGWAQGRFFVGSGQWGTQHGVYIADNTTVDMSVRPGFWNQNSGEQILWEGNPASFSGSPVAATATSVRFAGLGATLAGDRVTVVDGKGLGQHRAIVGYDAATGTTTLDAPWNVVPDASSTITIGLTTENVVVYHNHLDGKAGGSESSASAGVEIWGGGFGFIVDGNTIHDMARAGIVAQATGSADLPEPVFNNVFINNLIENTRVGLRMISGTSGEDTAYFNNVLRDNMVSQASDIGLWLRANLAHEADGLIAERNTVTGSGTAVDVHYMNNLLLRDNLLRAGGAPGQATVGINFETSDNAVLLGNQVDGFTQAFKGAVVGVLEAPQRVLAVTAGAAGVGEQAQPTITLVNGGAAALSWSATSDAAWVTMDISAGTIDAGENTDVPVTIDAHGLAPGVYRAKITVTSGQQTMASSIILTVEGQTPEPADVRSLRGEYTGGAGFGLAASDFGEGEAASVEFFRDRNDNGILDADDTCLGADADGGDGWHYTGTTAAFRQGTNRFFARAKDRRGDTGAAASVVLTFNTATAPAIDSLSYALDARRPFQRTILIANGVLTPGVIDRVEFFLDSNRDGQFDPAHDGLGGVDRDGSDGWSVSRRLTFASFGQTYFVRAVDDAGNYSLSKASTALSLIPLRPDGTPVPWTSKPQIVRCAEQALARRHSTLSEAWEGLGWLDSLSEGRALRMSAESV